MKYYLLILFCVFSSSALNLAIASQVILTPEESTFLEQHPTIILGGNVDWAPYVINMPNGQVTGFDQGVLDLINEKTGANFHIVSGEWANIVAQAQARDSERLISFNPLGIRMHVS